MSSFLLIDGVAVGAVELTVHTVQTTDATVTALVAVVVASNTEICIDVPMGNGHEDATDDHFAFSAKCWAKNVGGTLTIIKQVKDSTGDAAVAWPGITWVVNGTTLELRVTGEAAHTIDWECREQRMVTT